LQFEIRDTGVGLTPEQIGRLFQPFTQADGSTTRRYGGTGLGLSICKRLVEMMHGRIEVRSEPGRGSSFTFTAEFGVADATIGHEPSPDLRGLKVLVVDDHEASREYLHNVLSSLSFEVVSAASGAEALEILAKPSEGRAIELILMDWQMPGLDGIETTRQIEARSAGERTPTIIMVTAFGREQAMAHAGDAPIDEFLVKPLTPSTLFEAIMRVFKKEHPHRRPDLHAQEALPDTSRLQGVRVLLVEDNDLNQEVATTMLTRAGLSVRTAENGREALVEIENHTFDLVLMDCQMPEMDGYECTREIRRRQHFARLPIIAMTANAVAGDRERCLAIGMNDHVPKPIDPNQLFRVLLHWAPERPVTAATGAPTTVANDKPGARKEAGHGLAPATRDAGALLARLAAIDAASALSRCGNDPQMLVRLLIKFRDRNRGFGEAVGQAMRSGKWVEAKRLAHTLKGVAATVGARQLPQLAADLERLLGAQAEQEAVPVLLATEACLLELLTQIDAVLTPPAAKGAVSTQQDHVNAECHPPRRGTPGQSAAPARADGADAAAATAALQALLVAVRADDAAAFEHLAKVRACFGGRPDIEEELQRIHEALESYAFDEAVPVVERLLKDLTTP